MKFRWTELDLMRFKWEKHWFESIWILFFNRYSLSQNIFQVQTCDDNFRISNVPSGNLKYKTNQLIDWFTCTVIHRITFDWSLNLFIPQTSTSTYLRSLILISLKVIIIWSLRFWKKLQTNNIQFLNFELAIEKKLKKLFFIFWGFKIVPWGCDFVTSKKTLVLFYNE